MLLENLNKRCTILTTLILSFSLGFINSQDFPGIVKISGKITNPNEDKISIIKKGYKKEIQLNENGEFSDTLKIKAGEYTFYDYRESSALYLEPGFNLEITLDTKEFDETIQYSGIGSGPNNFLANYFMFKEKNTSSNKEMTNQEYFDNEIINYEKALSLLNNSTIENENFILKQQQIIFSDHLSNLFNKIGKDYFQYKTTANISQYLDKKVDKIDFKNESIFQSSSSKIFLNTYFTIGLVSDNSNCLSIYNNELSEQQKKGIINSLKRGISFYNLDEIESYYNILRKLITDDSAFSAIENKYQKILKLQKGNTSPLFNYPDTNGQYISLESLKGKLVYIDVWATWCGPCRAQIPYLKEMEEKYRSKKIEFVSLSIDQPKDIQKWKNMIAEKELKGIQIMADKAWRSSFVIDYIIDGIPRFILVDKSGNIISPNAPRPAIFENGSYVLNQKLEKLFDNNL